MFHNDYIFIENISMNKTLLLLLISLPHFLCGKSQVSVEANLQEIELQASPIEKALSYEKAASNYLKTNDFNSFKRFDKLVRIKFTRDEIVMVRSLEFNGSFMMEMGQLDSAIIFFDSVLALSNGKYYTSEVEALFGLVHIYRNLNELEKSEEYCNRILKLKELKNYEKGKAFLDLGIIYNFKGTYNLAVEKFLIADSLLTNDSKEKASVYSCLANVYMELGDFESSEKYYNAAYKIAEEQLDTFSMNVINGVYKPDVEIGKGNYEKAHHYLLKGQQYFTKNYSYYYLNYIETSLGINEINRKNYSNAIDIFESILSKNKNELTAFEKSEIHLSLAECHLNLKEWQLCKKHIDSTWYYSDSNLSDYIILFILEKEEKLYSRQGKFKEAFEVSKKIRGINNNIDSLASIELTNELMAKFESERKDEVIISLKTKNELVKQQKLNQRNILIAGISITSIIGLLFFFLYRNRQKTSAKLKEIDTIKTRFFENISHEFRTPLTLIKLPLSQAINNEEKLDLKELNLMHNNASRLQNLIEDLLSLSELEAGKMIIKKSEQDPLVQSKTLSSQFDSYAESKGINYHKVIERNSIKATYDKSVVDKVLANLISNAIKYSETGGEVQVSVAMVDQKLVMKVSDQGDGITPEDQEKIFERFYRVGETDEGKQGSGIGLALVKKLLEINNGTIEVTSKINEGSTFTATIPLENIIQLPYEPIPESSITKKHIKRKKEDLLDVTELSDKPKLLITEDNKELLEYISDLFKDDFQLINATDGEEGMKQALEFVPDFIISDWMMPNKNGLEFCKEIKTNSVTSHIPFLLLTAKSMVEDKIEGYETGADAYFSKPFNFNELKARINSLLKQRQLLYDKYSGSDIRLSAASNNSLDIEFWGKFKAYLKDNIRESEALNATKFSDHLGMSRMQLHRKLIALTGKNLSAFIKNQRINLACELLKDKSLRISDVCYEIGYEDKSAFARVFKQELGITPTQFRKNLEKN